MPTLRYGIDVMPVEEVYAQDNETDRRVVSTVYDTVMRERAIDDYTSVQKIELEDYTGVLNYTLNNIDFLSASLNGTSLHIGFNGVDYPIKLIKDRDTIVTQLDSYNGVIYIELIGKSTFILGEL